MINYNNIAQDCGVSAQTVSSYFDILEDTLIGYRVPAFNRLPAHAMARRGLGSFGGRVSTIEQF